MNELLEETPNMEKVPTKEEIMNFLQEQIEVKKLQVELQELNTRLAKGKAEELQALNFVGNITNPKPPADAVPYQLTEEDFENNPELKEQGLNVGDEVLVPKEMAAETEEKKRSLKKNK
jgi:hypothetical protein